MTFWYLVFKNVHNLSVIIHLWKLLRHVTLKIWKIHTCRKLRIKQTSILLCKYILNESFNLYGTYIHKIVKNHQQIFCKDPCSHAPTRSKNVRACILSRQNAIAHVYASCERVCARICMKNLTTILYYFINTSLKFYKDRKFRCGDICKTIITFV